jgi:hypothetical protein
MAGTVGLTPPGTAVPNRANLPARQTATQIDLFFVNASGVVNVMWVVGVGVWGRARSASPLRACVTGQPDRGGQSDQ